LLAKLAAAFILDATTNFNSSKTSIEADAFPTVFTIGTFGANFTTIFTDTIRVKISLVQNLELEEDITPL
jgi:hypothetical protein